MWVEKREVGDRTCARCGAEGHVNGHYSRRVWHLPFNILEAISPAGHSCDLSYKDCVKLFRKVRACRTTKGWKAVPVQRKVGSLYEKLDVDPSDLSLLAGTANLRT